MMKVGLQNYLKASFPCLFMKTVDAVKTEKEIRDAVTELKLINTEKPDKSKVEIAVWKMSKGWQKDSDDEPARASLLDALVIIEQMPVREKPIRKSKTSEQAELIGGDEPEPDEGENDSGPKPLIAIFHHVRMHINTSAIIQQMLDTINACRINGCTIILIGSEFDMPPELRAVITHCESLLPNRKEITDLYRGMTQEFVEAHGKKVKIPRKKEQFEELLNEAAGSALGLDIQNAENALALSFTTARTIDHQIIQAQKEQEIKKADVLEYMSTDENLTDTVGGFDVLKTWVEKRKCAFTDEARKYGLPYPKGILLAGPPGTGKSLVAQAIGTYLKLPILRLDIGRVFRSLVGNSEAAIRSALQIAEIVSPCLLLFDEIDKGFAGVSNTSGDLDSGVTQRVLQTWLTWRQETKAPVMVVATANNIETLPAMIYRKGRFDEVFFCDLPAQQEREQIFAIHLKKKGRDPKKFNLSNLAKASNLSVGAEIEAIVNDALFNAFSNKGREVQTLDLMNSISDTIPQAKRDHKEIESIRKWGAQFARNVSGIKPYALLSAKNKSSVKRKMRNIHLN